MSTSLLLIELSLHDAQGGHSERTYSGYVGFFRAVERIPLAVAWNALSDAAPADTPRETADEADRELLLRIWKQAAERPWYGEQAPLGMAGAAGSPKLIPLIVPALDSDLPRTQELAVSALAAITGWDARRDATGRERPLAEVTSEYRRECSVH